MESAFASVCAEVYGSPFAHNSAGSNLRGMCTLRPAAVACVKPRCHGEAPACTTQGHQVCDDELDVPDDASYARTHTHTRARAHSHVCHAVFVSILHRHNYKCGN